MKKGDRVVAFFMGVMGLGFSMVPRSNVSRILKKLGDADPNGTLVEIHGARKKDAC